MPKIAKGLFDAALNNIIHNTITSRHQEHKMILATLDATTRLPHCQRCDLPKLLEPPIANHVRGAISNPPSDTIYCGLRPWCRKSGHDIYANPFPKTDITGRPSKKKDNDEKEKDDGTPDQNSDDGNENPRITNGNSKDKLEKGEKKASKIDERLKKGNYVPWQTCPNCKRSLLIVRFAKHLEVCLGLAGRQASRNAMAKMNGSGHGSGAASTPVGSRSGTPTPDGRRENGDDDDDGKFKGTAADRVRKKLLKKAGGSKLKKDTATAKAEKGFTNGAKAGEANKRSFVSTLDADDDAEDSDSTVRVKKRQKLQRVESNISFASQSTAQVADMERVESQDAYVNDASSLIDDESFEDD